MKHFSEYNWQLDLKNQGGIYSLGITSGSTYYKDPRRLVFLLSRYKFVSKMLSGFNSVAEVGCGDGFGARLVRQTVDKLSCFDIEPDFIEDAKTRIDSRFPIAFQMHDILLSPMKERYDAIYSLDVIEHISSDKESDFIENIKKSLNSNGVVIIGAPTLESQIYATADSNEHINCKSGLDLKNFLKMHFQNVFLFSMNDEVVHTGFEKMAHYSFCLCTDPKKS